MLRTSVFLIIFIFNIIPSVSAIAHKIHFTNGKVITTESCWEENGNVSYQKYGTIITINKEQVDKVIYDNREEYRRSTIYFKDGESIYCEKIIKEYENVKCYSRDVFTSFEANKINKIVKGTGDKFFEIPKSAQLKWGLATIFFKDTRYKNRTNLLVRKVWTENNTVYCETETEKLKFDKKYVSRVLKGHLRNPDFHEMTIDEQEIAKQKFYRKELEKERLRRSLEEDIDKMIRSE